VFEKIMRESSVDIQFDLQVTLRKIEVVEKALAGELDEDETFWYTNRLGELARYRDSLISELTRRGEEIDVRRG